MFNRASLPLLLAWWQLAFLPLVAGHGFIAKPAMRGGSYGNTLNAYCPHCLGTTNLPMPVCGKNKILDVLTGPFETLKAGEMFEVQIKITAHHKGHFTLRLCDKQVSSSMQGDPETCFNEHILQRVRPEQAHTDCRVNDPRGDCQPIDESNPGYWYLPPPGWEDRVQVASADWDDSMAVPYDDGFADHPASLLQTNASTKAGANYRFHYWVPQGFTCDKCTLQWAWKSANSCVPHPDAYKCYFQYLERLGWNANSWCSGACTYNGQCPANQGPPTPCAEEFANCADVIVVDEGAEGGPGGSQATPSPPTPPTPLPPTSPVTPAPPAPTPNVGGGACVQNPDCEVNDWCTDSTYVEWCPRHTSSECPSPQCMLSSAEPEPESEPESEPEVEPESPAPEPEPEAEPTPESEPEPEPESEPEVPPTSPVTPPPPAPTPSVGSTCVQNPDCNTNPWCNDQAYVTWCPQQGTDCPSPHCMLSSSSGTGPEPTPVATPEPQAAPTSSGPGTCRNSACGCPPFTNGAPWCKEDNSLSGPWCQRSESNCNNCGGAVWCPGSSLVQLQPASVKVKKHSFRGTSALGLLEISRSYIHSLINEEEAEEEDTNTEL